MRTLLQFIVLLLGGVLMLAGWASAEDQPVPQVESTIAPTTEAVAEDEVVEEQASSKTFVFYNSHASW